MTTPDEKERVGLGEKTNHATVRHLWGMVYGVSRPGWEEFRITANEVEDLAEYVKEDQKERDHDTRQHRRRNE